MNLLDYELNICLEVVNNVVDFICKMFNDRGKDCPVPVLLDRSSHSLNPVQVLFPLLLLPVLGDVASSYSFCEDGEPAEKSCSSRSSYLGCAVHQPVLHAHSIVAALDVLVFTFRIILHKSWFIKIWSWMYERSNQEMISQKTSFLIGKIEDNIFYYLIHWLHVWYLKKIVADYTEHIRERKLATVYLHRK